MRRPLKIACSRKRKISVGQQNRRGCGRVPAENRPTRKSNKGVDAARVVPNARIRRFGHSRARARTADLRDLRAGCANPSVPSKTRSSPARGRIIKLHRPLHRAGYPPSKSLGQFSGGRSPNSRGGPVRRSGVDLQLMDLPRLCSPPAVPGTGAAAGGSF